MEVEEEPKSYLRREHSNTLPSRLGPLPPENIVPYVPYRMFHIVTKDFLVPGVLGFRLRALYDVP